MCLDDFYSKSSEPLHNVFMFSFRSFFNFIQFLWEQSVLCVTTDKVFVIEGTAVDAFATCTKQNTYGQMKVAHKRA